MVGHDLRDLQTASAMVTSAASGQLEGNHGFFQQFNIQSLSLRGLKKDANRNGRIGFLDLGMYVTELSPLRRNSAEKSDEGKLRNEVGKNLFFQVAHFLSVIRRERAPVGRRTILSSLTVSLRVAHVSSLIDRKRAPLGKLDKICLPSGARFRCHRMKVCAIRECDRVEFVCRAPIYASIFSIVVPSKEFAAV